MAHDFFPMTTNLKLTLWFFYISTLSFGFLSGGPNITTFVQAINTSKSKSRRFAWLTVASDSSSAGAGVGTGVAAGPSGTGFGTAVGTDSTGNNVGAGVGSSERSGVVSGGVGAMSGTSSYRTIVVDPDHIDPNLIPLAQPQSSSLLEERGGFETNGLGLTPRLEGQQTQEINPVLDESLRTSASSSSYPSSIYPSTYPSASFMELNQEGTITNQKPFQLEEKDLMQHDIEDSYIDSSSEPSKNIPPSAHLPPLTHLEVEQPIDHSKGIYAIPVIDNQVLWNLEADERRYHEERERFGQEMKNKADFAAITKARAKERRFIPELTLENRRMDLNVRNGGREVNLPILDDKTIEEGVKRSQEMKNLIGKSVPVKGGGEKVGKNIRVKGAGGKGGRDVILGCFLGKRCFCFFHLEYNPEAVSVFHYLNLLVKNLPLPSFLIPPPSPQPQTLPNVPDSIQRNLHNI